MKIFRLITMAAALLSVSASAFAEGKIAIGGQGGITFPDYHFKDTSPAAQYGNKNGWLGGIFLEFGVWAITIRPELNYVTKTYTVLNVAEVKNHYLEVPVFLKINPFTDSLVSPFILVGPQWSKQIRTETTTVAPTTVYINTADKWDLAGVAGLGIEFNILKNIGLNVQGRYAYGFRDMGSSTVEVKARAFYALAGISFQNAF